jgi:hypothetical protein
MLEAPGLREPLWTTHRLSPKPRWTIVWLTPIDPRLVRAYLNTLTPISQAIQTAVWRQAGVLGNPLPEPWRLHVMDHTQFLRSGVEAHLLEEQLGIPSSPVAYVERRAVLPPTAVLALEGAGVRCILQSDDNGTPLERLNGPDGSQVLSARVTPGGDPQWLGFTESEGARRSRMERWLTLADRQVETRSTAVAFMVSESLDESIPAAAAAVRDWNGQFAYPRILTGGVDELEQQFQEAAPSIPSVPYHPDGCLEIPSAATLASMRQDRFEESTETSQSIFSPLAQLIAPESRRGAALQAIADHIQTAVPGTLVFNTTPFRRTDIVRLPNGRMTVATDVPPMGYAFFVEEPARNAPPQSLDASPARHVVQHRDFQLQLDQKTGAISALAARSDGRAWVRGTGLNAVRGAILEGLERENYQGIGTSLTAYRWSSDLQQFRTTVTIYDALPWIDIENHVDAQLSDTLQYRFEFATVDPTVHWEIPAGHRESQAPVERAAHLRWITVRSGLDTVLFRGLDAPYFSVLRDGAVVSFGPAGLTRFRFRVARFPADTLDATRFGWSAEPFVTVPVGENPDGTLPRFGKLLVLDQPEAAIIGLKAADNGDGVIVYVQELLGQASFLSLGPGLLRFDGARRVDYLERDLDDSVTVVPDGVAFRSRPWGVTALRLLNVQLNGG